MNNQLKISIITVSYNAADTIETTIQSVCNQSYPNIEYIIVDGGSADGTVDIVQRHDTKISYFVSEQDGGIYDAMNKGISRATGDYIYFLGADDCLLDEDIIEKVVSLIDKDTDILSAGVYLVDESMLLQRYMSGMFAADKSKFNGLMIPHQGMFVKRKILQENLFDLKYKIASDYDFFLKCYLNDSVKLKFVDIPVAYYSSGGVSTSSFRSNDEYVDIMTKYKLPASTINYVCTRFNKPWKQWIKNILRSCGIMKWLFMLMGAEKHQCTWNFCRWCKRMR